MKAELTKSETEVGLMLASGKTTKEVANERGTSFHTANQHKRNLYKKTGSRNLADITRKMISRVSNIDTEKLIIEAMRYSLVVFAVFFLLYFIVEDNLINELKALLPKLKTLISNFL